MKKINKALTGWVWKGQSAVATILLAGSAIRVGAQSYTISAGDASIQINLSGADAGISDWTLNNNEDDLNQQWYYYSVNGGPVYSIDNIGLLSSTESTSGGQTTVGAIYENSSIEVQVNSTLSPGNGGQSVLSSDITLTDLTGTQNTYNFYQYSDFDIGGGLGNQTVRSTPPASGIPRITQTSSTGESLVATFGAVSAGTGDTIKVQTGTFDGTDGSDQFGLYDGNNPAPNLNNNLSAGPGNVDFAYQIYNASLGPNTTSGLSFTELETVPEPSTISLIFSGMLASWLYYGRKLASFKKVWKKALL